MTRYRLDVVAASVADAVQSAGGWLYDRAMAGWDVNVLLPRRCSVRPLAILGARALDLETELASRAAGSTSQSVAVSAGMFAADPRVRRTVLHALDGGLTEVALWGEGWPLPVARRAGARHHRLSAAARAFKGCALTAAGIDWDVVDLIEEFHFDHSSGAPVTAETLAVESEGR